MKTKTVLAKIFLVVFFGVLSVMLFGFLHKNPSTFSTHLSTTQRDTSILVRTSAGVITDVWIVPSEYISMTLAGQLTIKEYGFNLSSAIVVSEGSSIKEIRLRDGNPITNHVEYHMDEDSMTYYERRALSKK